MRYNKGVSLLATLVTSWSQHALSAPKSTCLSKQRLNDVSEFAGTQLRHLSNDVLVHVDNFTDYTDVSGKWELDDKTVWTSGMTAGMFWKQFEFTELEEWKGIAENHTMGLDGVELLDDNDLGFQVHNSYGMGHKLTGDTKYLEYVIRGAKSLFDFRYVVDIGGIGAFWSWASTKKMPHWDLAVNVDMMMNMEIILYVAALTNNNAYKTAVINHAALTMQDIVRDDYSTFHVAEYSTTTYKLEEQGTYQGATAKSTWSRGQAWAIYGYVMVYRFTKDEDHLAASIKLLNYYHKHLPEDYVPYADFDYNDENSCKDSSSATITASACMELFSITGEFKYLDFASTYVDAVLSEDYYMPDADDGYESILRRGCKEYGANETGTVFGDYFLLETMNRYKRMGLTILLSNRDKRDGCSGYDDADGDEEGYSTTDSFTQVDSDSMKTARPSSSSNSTLESVLVHTVCDADLSWLIEKQDAVAWFGVHLENLDSVPSEIYIGDVVLDLSHVEWVEGNSHVELDVTDYVPALKALTELSQISIEFTTATTNARVTHLVIGHRLTFGSV